MVVIDTSLRDRLLYVVHVERGERDRIISARNHAGSKPQIAVGLAKDPACVPRADPA